MLDFTIRRRAYYFMLNKLRVPRPVATGLVKGSTIALSPSAQKRRKTSGAAMANALTIPEQDGYLLLDPASLPGAAEAIAALRAMFEKERSRNFGEEEHSKPFLVSVISSQQDLLATPAVRDYVLSDAVVDTVLKYFGEIPILTSVKLLWTPPNETVRESQLYHYDTEDDRQLKLFLNVFDVTPDCGPFTLLPAALSKEVGLRSGYGGGRRSRLADGALAKEADEGREVKAMGPAGGGIFVDTSRCLHYGSRGNRSPRLVLLAQFMSVNAPKIKPIDWSPVTDRLGPLDATRRLLLQV